MRHARWPNVDPSRGGNAEMQTGENSVRCTWRKRSECRGEFIDLASRAKPINGWLETGWAAWVGAAARGILERRTTSHSRYSSTRLHSSTLHPSCAATVLHLTIESLPRIRPRLPPRPARRGFRERAMGVVVASAPQRRPRENSTRVPPDTPSPRWPKANHVRAIHRHAARLSDTDSR